MRVQWPDRSRWNRTLCLLLLCASPIALAAQSVTETPHRAGILVRQGDGSIHTACVTFSEPAISGLALLERSGFDVKVAASGGNAAVCSIQGEGCAFPQQDCFCQCKGAGACRYWAYWHLLDNGWQYASTGAPGYEVPPGGVDGWTWGPGNAGAAAKPPATSFAQICPAAPATSIAVTSTSRPAAGAASRPASTPGRSATAGIVFAVSVLLLLGGLGLARRRRR